MFANSVLVRCDVDAVDFVLGYVAMQPLHLRAQVLENAARFLRDGLQLLVFEVSGAGNLALNYILGHSCLQQFLYFSCQENLSRSERLQTGFPARGYFAMAA